MELSALKKKKREKEQNRHIFYIFNLDTTYQFKGVHLAVPPVVKVLQQSD